MVLQDGPRSPLPSPSASSAAPAVARVIALGLCILYRTGLEISAMATVPFSNRSNFYTAPSFKYSRNLEYDIRLDADSRGLAGSALAGWTKDNPVARMPVLQDCSSFLLVGLTPEGVLWFSFSLMESLLWLSLETSWHWETGIWAVVKESAGDIPLLGTRSFSFDSKLWRRHLVFGSWLVWRESRGLFK